jgi:hypothetical protein
MIRPMLDRRTFLFNYLKPACGECREPYYQPAGEGAHQTRFNANAKFTGKLTKHSTLPLGGEASRRYPEWGMAGFA